MAVRDRIRWVGIIGYPISHSLSPIMQNAAFEALGLEYCYIPLEVKPAGLRSAVGALRRLGFRGFNVTVPHKQRIIPMLDVLSPEARFIGAVNTVVIQKGRLTGYNTDGRGFMRALNEMAGFSVQGKRALVLGAGGAARAVAYQLAREGAAEVIVANRSLDRVRGLIRDLRESVPRSDATILPWKLSSLKIGAARADLVVNATSVGMRASDPSLLPGYAFRRGQVVYDLVYRPAVTPLMRQAMMAGAHAINGLGMLVHQGALSFELWTARKPSVELMRETLQGMRPTGPASD